MYKYAPCSHSRPRLQHHSYNVKRFVGAPPARECTIESIGHALRGLAPDVICLNEVDIRRWGEDSTLPRLEAALGMHVEFFGHALGGQYGNAICSSLPMRRTHEVALEGGSQIRRADDKMHRIVRGLLVCDVDASSRGLGTLSVAATHLDHMDEAERVTQLQHVRAVLAKVAEQDEGERGVVLCGDLNALTPDDYTEDQWAKLEERHAARGWALHHGCLDVLHEADYVDCALALGAPGAAGDKSRFTASVEAPQYRIDYCFAHRNFLQRRRLGDGGLVVADTRVLDHVRHSDHFPILWDFHARAPSSSSSSSSFL